MSATVTLDSRIETAKKYIERNFNPEVEGNYSFFYTGRTKPWDDEYSPDVSDSSGKSNFDTLFQRIFLKQITKEDTSLSIRRFDWMVDRVYTRADYNVDYTDYRKWVHPESPYYVINSEGNVYKCISNGYGSESTVEPTGQSYGYTYLGDGYIWKFMFALSYEMNTKFLTDKFIPVPYEEIDKDFSQLQVEGNAVSGDIIHIHVNNGGTGYTSPPVIQIRGDGSGAIATAIMEGEVIKGIQIANAGQDYTYADVHIFGNGLDGDATAMVSPNGGHGSNAVREMGAFFLQMVEEIISNEDNVAPIMGTYRNIGVVKNTLNKTGEVITDEKYNTLSDINIINSSGSFLSNEVIIGEESKAQGVVYNDPTGTDKILTVYMIDGTFQDGEYVHGQQTGETGQFVEAGSTYTNVDIRSGELLYKENIIFITRRDVQIEKFVFSIEF